MNAKKSADLNNYRIEVSNDFRINDEELIFPLCKIIFKNFDPQHFWQRLKDKNKIYLVKIIDSSTQTCVAFKLGYEIDILRYYSWIGGVHPEHRKLGLAQKLMNLQHQWAKTQKFQWIQTKSENEFKSMMILNLKNGFDIINTETTQSGKTKILFQKKL